MDQLYTTEGPVYVAWEAEVRVDERTSIRGHDSAPALERRSVELAMTTAPWRAPGLRWGGCRAVLNRKQKVPLHSFPKKARRHTMCWRLVAVGGWGLVVDGGWQLAVGRRWRLAVGGWWRLAADGPLGRSLRAVLTKKISSPSRTPPGMVPRGPPTRVFAPAGNTRPPLQTPLLHHHCRLDLYGRAPACCARSEGWVPCPGIPSNRRQLLCNCRRLHSYRLLHSNRRRLPSNCHERVARHVTWVHALHRCVCVGRVPAQAHVPIVGRGRPNGVPFRRWNTRGPVILAPQVDNTLQPQGSVQGTAPSLCPPSAVGV